MKSFPEILGRYVLIRPIAASDADFLFDLRKDPVLTQFLNDGPATLAEQRQWMDRYFERENDFNFLVVSNATKKPIGTVALVDIDRVSRRAEPGRWLIRGDSASAVESDLLCNTFAFEALALETLHFSVLTQNTHVVSYHTKCGARWIATAPNHTFKNGVPYDAHLYELDRDTFERTKRPLLEKLLYGISTKSRGASIAG